MSALRTQGFFKMVEPPSFTHSIWSDHDPDEAMLLNRALHNRAALLARERVSRKGGDANRIVKTSKWTGGIAE